MAVFFYVQSLGSWKYGNSNVHPCIYASRVNLLESRHWRYTERKGPQNIYRDGLTEKTEIDRSDTERDRTDIEGIRGGEDHKTNTEWREPQNRKGHELTEWTKIEQKRYRGEGSRDWEYTLGGGSGDLSSEQSVLVKGILPATGPVKSHTQLLC